MRALVQRVAWARVKVDECVVGEVGRGFLVLLGIHKDDGEAELNLLADKVVGVRCFEDSAGKMNLALADVGGKVLLVSQFTLLADTRHGRRPSFTDAKAPAEASPMVQRFAQRLASQGIEVQQGIFGADMKVELCNDGPVTLLLDTDDWKRKPSAVSLSPSPTTPPSRSGQ